MEAKAKEMLDSQGEAAAGEYIGTLAQIRYFDDGFLIGKIELDKDSRAYVDYMGNLGVKGHMIAPQIGLRYTLCGQVEKTKYGPTLAFEDYKTELPTSAGAIQTYLRENCPGVGPATAKKIVIVLGNSALEEIKRSADCLSGIRGISAKQAEAARKVLIDNERTEAVWVEMHQLFDGVRTGKRLQRTIIQTFGVNEVIDTITSNPYCLVAFRGISFLGADLVATNIGFARGSEYRIRAGLTHVLKEHATGQGSTAIDPYELIKKAVALLSLSGDRVWDSVTGMHKDGKIVADYEAVPPWIMLAEYYEKEQCIADRLFALIEHEAGVKVSKAQLDSMPASLAPDQIAAVGAAMGSKVFILTGAPGTGKTYTIRAIMDLFCSARIALAAPTGKAASRMSELTGRHASTIHRLLGPAVGDDGEFYFEYGPDKRIPADIVVLDEVSMIAVGLFSSLLSALNDSTRLILVGDTNQLPPVGPGAALRDMLESGMIASCELTQIKRQDAGLIVRNCHAIKDGSAPRWQNKPGDDYYHIEEPDVNNIAPRIADMLLSGRLEKAFDVSDLLRDVQVLAPLREKTTASVKALNERLQVALNAKNKANTRFWVGDKVINTRNNYELCLVNGDIGYIRRIGDKVLSVEFESPGTMGRAIEISKKDNDLQLAYAVTCHKYQGSEAPVIVFPVHRSFGSLILQRNWLYTAISRAQRACIVVGQAREVRATVKRIAQAERVTNLVEFLGDAFAVMPINRGKE